MHSHISSPSDEPPSPLQPLPSQNLPNSHPSEQLHQFPRPSLNPPPPTDRHSPNLVISEMPPGKQKDLNDPLKKRSPEPIDNPPAKRPREPTKPKRKPTWYDTIRDAWSILENHNSGRHHFRIREIVKVVDAHWTELRGEEKKQKGWRNQLSRAVRKEAMLTRVQSDGQSDLYAMKDPDFQPPPSRPAKRSPGPENETVPEESVYHVSIPTEWTAEAFKPVRISAFDKSAALQFVNDDPNTIKGHKGYRMARATSGVIEGDWYFEATVVQLRDSADTVDGAVRLGWSQRRSDVETPVGFDAYGFGLRDRTGEFIHAARLKPYGDKFSVGDVIGCRISLPQLTDEQKARVDEAERAWLTYRFINMLQGQAPQDSATDIMKDGMVQFYKNGTPMGIPSFFSDATGTTSKPTSVPKREMKAGVYYPTVALYGNAIVQANFGPDFGQPLPEGSRPMCEAAREAPVVEEKEVIEIVDDTPSNPIQVGSRPSSSDLPQQPPIPVISTSAENDETERDDRLSFQPNVEAARSAGQEQQEMREEHDNEGAVDSRVDASTSIDISREGADQPQPEPMAIEA